jgi:mono/diheme cytochrome c family protein
LKRRPLLLLAALAVTAGVTGCARKNLTTPELYETYCTRCHGERIAEGYGPMPAFKRRLEPQEVERLVDYTLQLSRPPKETP